MKKKIINFADDLDEKTIKQFENCTNKDFVISAALMPDAHYGYVAPIGSVLVTKDYIVPSWVGYDIGCGVIAIKLKSKTNENVFEKVENQKTKNEIFEKINNEIPMGVGAYNKVENIANITNKTKIELKNIQTLFEKNKIYNKNILNIIKQNAMIQIGSLGSGNHFIELGVCEKDKRSDELWLIIHSGSRGIGHGIAKKYMQDSSGKKRDFEKTCPFKITSEKGKEYFNALNYCLQYAFLNRLEMAYKIHKILENILCCKLEFQLWTNKNHNHAVLKSMKEENIIIHRKGATSANKGERGIIPGNMRDGSFLVEGLGNEDFLNSSTHGAGRKLSRVQANQLSYDDFQKDMENVLANVSTKTIDECPKAYKNIFEIMALQKKSVKIVKHIIPIINWKK